VTTICILLFVVYNALVWLLAEAYSFTCSSQFARYIQ